MKKINLYLLGIAVLTFAVIIYLSFFNLPNYECTENFKVISRNEWKANPPLDTADEISYEMDLLKVLKNIVIHHSAFSGNFGVENIQSYQQDNGFNDIAYHYLISKDGKIFEGRNINIVGAHAGETLEANNLADSIRKHLDAKNIIEAYKLDPDYGSIGVCLDGNFEKEKPTSCQIRSLKKLLSDLMQKYNIDKNNIMLHNEARELLIVQKKLQSVKDETVCPGIFGANAIKKALKEIK